MESDDEKSFMTSDGNCLTLSEMKQFGMHVFTVPTEEVSKKKKVVIVKKHNFKNVESVQHK